MATARRSPTDTIAGGHARSASPALGHANPVARQLGALPGEFLGQALLFGAPGEQFLVTLLARDHRHVAALRCQLQPLVDLFRRFDQLALDLQLRFERGDRRAQLRLIAAQFAAFRCELLRRATAIRRCELRIQRLFGPFERRARAASLLGQVDARQPLPRIDRLAFVDIERGQGTEAPRLDLHQPVGRLEIALDAFDARVFAEHQQGHEQHDDRCEYRPAPIETGWSRNTSPCKRLCRASITSRR